MTVIVVHYRSDGMLIALLRDLALQQDITLDLHIVECGDDGTVSAARKQGYSFSLAVPGENLGYCAGNNLVMREMLGLDTPICVINPDVTLPDPRTLRKLCDALEYHRNYAAVAPSIRDPNGRIEYTGGMIDLDRARAVHTGTHVSAWPTDTSDLVDMSWIDGACWVLRTEAVRIVGLFDERFFLFSEEVDWCLRAGHLGWRVGVVRDVEIQHLRSSSFGSSTKGAYYAWRNRYLITLKHRGYGVWIASWLMQLLMFARQRRNIRSGESLAALRGAGHAIAGRSGRMRGDA